MIRFAKQEAKAKSSSSWILVPIHSGYILLISVTLVDGIGATCTDETLYPNVGFVAFVIFTLFYFVTCVFRYNKYFFNW